MVKAIEIVCFCMLLCLQIRSWCFCLNADTVLDAYIWQLYAGVFNKYDYFSFFIGWTPEFHGVQPMKT